MLQKAILGGVHGTADLQSRRRSVSQRDWRGTFAFGAEDEAVIARLASTPGATVLETMFEGEWKRLPVRVTSVSPDGLAFIEGSGEPY